VVGPRLVDKWAVFDNCENVLWPALEEAVRRHESNMAQQDMMHENFVMTKVFLSLMIIHQYSEFGA